MRSSKEASTGGVGVSEVAGLFERIRWAPVENRDRHDLGTDLLVAARDPRRYDRGLLIGVQVKGGPSWFKEPITEDDGALVGWMYRDDSEHFDYWVKHQLPHVLVLYDLDLRTGFWVHVTPERCTATGTGTKILVPKQNIISESDVPKLLQVALTQRGSISLEGTAFDAAAIHIAPGDRLRYALLVPRLVAPHANRSKVDNIEPEEVIAMLVLLQGGRLAGRLQDHAIWPVLNDEAKTSDWRWKFAHALWRYLAHGEISPIEQMHADAVRSDWRASATAVLASLHFMAGNVAAAASLVHAELEKDRSAPIETAWLHLHAAHYAFEQGYSEAAAQHVDAALPDLALDPDDVTASLLAGVGYNLRFALLGWGSTQIEVSATIKAGDNAGSWWRDQQLRWALDDAAADHFRQWAEDKTSRWESEPAQQQLVPSILMSAFSADHSAWAASEVRLARYEIQRAPTDEGVRTGLLRLLKAGDGASLQIAGNRLLNHGPATVLNELSALCTPAMMTRTRTDAILGFWAEFGDIGRRTPADEIVAWCLASLNAAATSERRIRTSQALKTLEGAIASASRAACRDIANALGNFKIDWTDLNDYARFVQALDERKPSNFDFSHVIAVAREHTTRHEIASLWAIAANAGVPDAREQLMRAVREGNWRATAIAYNRSILEAEDATKTARKLVDSLAEERERASRRSFGLGYDVDRCELLVALCARFPAAAYWNDVVDYLLDPNVIADHKERACRSLGHKVASLPESARQRLLARVGDLAASRYLPKNMLDMGAARRTATAVAEFVTMSFGGTDLEAYVSRAMVSGTQAKRFAFEVLRTRKLPGFDVVALQGFDDSSLSVRAQAAGFLAARIEEGNDCPALRTAATRALNDRGALLPRVFLSELSSKSPPWVLDQVETARTNVSARVRAEARRVLAGEDRADDDTAEAI